MLWLCICTVKLLSFRVLDARVDEGIFDVTSFGAMGDGVTYDTSAIRAAAAALRMAGGGTLLFPGGKTYLTGAFNISSNTRVQIERRAMVLGSTRGQDWPVVVAAEIWPQFGHGSDCIPGDPTCRLMHQSLLFGWNLSNISIGGGGSFNCNSQKQTWWSCAKNLAAPPCNGAGRPHCIMLANATDVEVSFLNVSNSPDWTLHFSSSTNIHVHHLNVHNPLEPNADGIDVDSSQNVLVEDCFFSVGDDALCVKSGIDYFGRRYHRPARDIIFRRNVIGTGHGITIGSETSGSVFNVTFEDIRMDRTGTGIRMKSERGRGGVVSNVVYRNIDMQSIDGQCVQVTLNYHQGLKPTNKTATPIFRNITLENVKCEAARNSYLLDGLPEQSIEGLQLHNVTMGQHVGHEVKCNFVDCTCDQFTDPCPSCCKKIHRNHRDIVRTTVPIQRPVAFYTVSGAGNKSANGDFYASGSPSKWVAASGMQLFSFEGRWYIGKYGTGPVLYQGACQSEIPPSNWTTYDWKGHISPTPLPRLSSSTGLPISSCLHCAYTLTHAGSADANGCYTQSADASFSFEHSGSSGIKLYRRAKGEWVIGKAGGEDMYVSNCASATEPPACDSIVRQGPNGTWMPSCGWHVADSGVMPGPTLSASLEFPLGYCPPGTPPKPMPHPRCETPECEKLWGAGCPDLNSIAPDLVRPSMLTGTPPRAGARVRAVAPGFESTQVYHPLYLPTDWANSSARRFPIIVEYMGNGPFNDGYGDISTGRPEDSNLGWGMADPPGSKYIWISMPFVTADLGNQTQVSVYWWGCPSPDARKPCNNYNITPTIRYLHSAVKQTISIYNGDPENIVITGWSRGAIATGAIGLYDDATSRLFKAFVPYSHLDGDCGWVDSHQPALDARWDRLGGRPMLYLGECAVATQGGPEWLKKIGQYGTHATSGMEFMTTGFANHNDAWVLRNSSARTYLRQWLVNVFRR